MPVKSQPRLTARHISRPTQPPPPPPTSKATKKEVETKYATAVGNGSNDVADSVKVSDMLHEDENSRGPTSQKLNFPQLNRTLQGSGSPFIRKSAPPVPTKPAHLQRNCLTPPPKPGNLSSVLGLSSYSLPEYEMSDLEHPQLSSTLKSQVLPRTPFAPKAQSEESKPEAEPKPPQGPVRRDSMKQINDVVGREMKRSFKTVVSTITSLEEGFITRFRPVCDFPAPDAFTSCEKSYPSIEQGCVGRRESDQLVTRSSLGSEEDIDPARDHPPPPLPSTAPPARSISQSNFNEHIPVIIPSPPAQPTVPPPTPLPAVESINIPEVKPSESSIPPPPPLLFPVPCPVPVYSGARPVVQASTPVIQTDKEHMICISPVVDDTPISVESMIKSGFADNLAKLYGSTKSCPDEPPPLLAAKPRPPVINNKPALLKGCGMKMTAPQRPSSLRLRQPFPAEPALPSNTSSCSTSLTLAISSPLSTSKTKTSPTAKPPRSAPPPPPPFRTSSLSTSPPCSTPPAVHCDSSAQSLSRSLSLRSAPPPPVPAYSTGQGRFHSLRTSSTSSSPLPKSSESITRKYSFRAAPPPPPHNPTESPSRESSSQGSSRLGGTFSVCCWRQSSYVLSDCH